MHYFCTTEWDDFSDIAVEVEHFATILFSQRWETRERRIGMDVFPTHKEPHKTFNELVVLITELLSEKCTDAIHASFAFAKEILSDSVTVHPQMRKKNT